MRITDFPGQYLLPCESAEHEDAGSRVRFSVSSARRGSKRVPTRGDDSMTIRVLDLPIDAATSGGLPCQVVSPELFFAEAPDDVERAKALCQACPVRLVCLADALERREPWGVWGGELFDQGVVIPRKRPRGRPRKEPVAA
jgi:WhiB family redox-sensing transcriptional regulator